MTEIGGATTGPAGACKPASFAVDEPPVLKEDVEGTSTGGRSMGGGAGLRKAL